MELLSSYRITQGDRSLIYINVEINESEWVEPINVAFSDGSFERKFRDTYVGSDNHVVLRAKDQTSSRFEGHDKVWKCADGFESTG